MSDLDRIFLATNFEEDRASEEARNNLDNALMRFEFLEALVRTAAAKFLETGDGAGRRGKRGKRKGGAKGASGGGKGGKATGKEAGKVAVAAAAAATGMTGLAAAAAAIGDASGNVGQPAVVLAELGPCANIADACVRLLDYHVLALAPPESKV